MLLARAAKSRSATLKARDTSSKIDWENLRFFLAVAQTGSLSRASRLLHTDHSTVRRRVEILEQQIGAQLFYRHARGYDLTSTAERMLQWVEYMHMGAQGMESALNEKAAVPTAVVRIRSSPLIAEALLCSFVHEFPKNLPEVRVEIHTDNEITGAPRADNEVAIRCARPQGLMVEALALGQLPLGLFGSPQYLRSHVEPRRVAELAGHDFLDWGQDDLAISQVYYELERQQGRRRTVMVSNSLHLLAAAATNGSGIALLPVGNVEAYSGLTRILPRFTFGPLEMFALCQPDWHTSWALRSVVELLQGAIIKRASCEANNSSSGGENSAESNSGPAVEQ